MDADEDRTYVYAFADRGLPARLRLGTHLLETMEIGGVAIVVEDRPTAAFSEEALRDQHDLLVELLQRVPSLLPVRFNTCLPRGDLRRLALARADELREGLRHVRNRVQITIRVAGPAAAREGGRISGAAYLAGRRTCARALDSALESARQAVSAFVVDERMAVRQGQRTAAAYHLVARADVDRYRSAFDAAAPGPAGTRRTMTGAWPAFAFVPEVL